MQNEKTTDPGFKLPGPTEQTAPGPASANAASAAQPSGYPPVAWSVRVDSPR